MNPAWASAEVNAPKYTLRAKPAWYASEEVIVYIVYNSLHSETVYQIRHFPKEIAFDYLSSGQVLLRELTILYPFSVCWYKTRFSKEVSNRPNCALYATSSDLIKISLASTEHRKKSKQTEANSKHPMLHEANASTSSLWTPFLTHLYLRESRIKQIKPKRNKSAVFFLYPKSFSIRLVT